MGGDSINNHHASQTSTRKQIFNACMVSIQFADVIRCGCLENCIFVLIGITESEELSNSRIQEMKTSLTLNMQCILCKGHTIQDFSIANLSNSHINCYNLNASILH